ncbi:MAG: DUF2809 domain-containing protein [Bacteroidota bacterium]
MNYKNRRVVYFILFLLVIPLGLSTRKEPQWYFSFMADYGGDILWSTMFFLLFRCFWPQEPLWKIALYTYSFSVAIEISQLYQAPWINSIRHTFLGSMLLGFSFSWSDILCYLVGTVAGLLIASIADRYTISVKENNE